MQPKEIREYAKALDAWATRANLTMQKAAEQMCIRDRIGVHDRPPFAIERNGLTPAHVLHEGRLVRGKRDRGQA